MKVTADLLCFLDAPALENQYFLYIVRLYLVYIFLQKQQALASH